MPYWVCTHARHRKLDSYDVSGVKKLISVIARHVTLIRILTGCRILSAIQFCHFVVILAHFTRNFLDFLMFMLFSDLLKYASIDV